MTQETKAAMRTESHVAWQVDPGQKPRTVVIRMVRTTERFDSAGRRRGTSSRTEVFEPMRVQEALALVTEIVETVAYMGTSSYWTDAGLPAPEFPDLTAKEE